MGIPVLFLTLRENSQYFIIKYGIYHGFLTDFIYQFEEVPFCSYFVECFIMKRS
jgi:hypothetical protein